MQKLHALVIASLLLCRPSVACSDELLQPEKSPIRIELREIRGGKPPDRFHDVRITLVNQQGKPVWFVLPYWGDTPLPEKGIFPNEDGLAQPFEGHGLDGEAGSAVEVLMLGEFNAFRLPARGRLELDGYYINASKDIDGIVVFEARELKVNGKTPLEKWLPYATTSGEKVKVGGRQLNYDWKNLDWDRKTLRSREDYPKEKVAEVKAEGFRSWTVKFHQKADKNAP